MDALLPKLSSSTLVIPFELHFSSPLPFANHSNFTPFWEINMGFRQLWSKSHLSQHRDGVRVSRARSK
jgi:hypothetical protein